MCRIHGKLQQIDAEADRQISRQEIAMNTPHSGRTIAGLLLLAASMAWAPAQASRWEARQEFREGVREIAREKREMRRDILRADSPAEARQAYREGMREIERERREMRREIRRELRDY
jgi:hypothetical protein